MQAHDLANIPLTVFVRVGAAEYLFLNRKAIDGINLVSTRLELEEMDSITVHELRMGLDGVHVGYIFRTPKQVMHFPNALSFTPSISLEAAKQCESTYYGFLFGLDTWVTSEGGVIILPRKYDASILKPL